MFAGMNTKQPQYRANTNNNDLQTVQLKIRPQQRALHWSLTSSQKDRGRTMDGTYSMLCEHVPMFYREIVCPFQMQARHSSSLQWNTQTVYAICGILNDIVSGGTSTCYCDLRVYYTKWRWSDKGLYSLPNKPTKKLSLGKPVYNRTVTTCFGPQRAIIKGS